MNLFYPSHDIALAHGVKHFNPPAAALRLQEDLAFLSDIWNQPYLNGETEIPLPWGWDWDTRDFIQRKYGVKMSKLPTDEELEQIRQLSSRRSSIVCLEKLFEKLFIELKKDLPDDLAHEDKLASLRVTMPQYLDSEDKLWDFITSHDSAGKPFVLKTPWSSSGRGLLVSHTKANTGLIVDNSRTFLMQQAMYTIRKMGGIMGEEWISDKVQDFAMLFYASEERVMFIGYSLFDNDNTSLGTTYRQGYLLSNDTIVERLGIRYELLTIVAKAYEEILTEMLQAFLGKSWHLGYLGIDMITYNIGDDSETLVGNDYITKKHLAVHPCIELNLRCTMGVVCRLWYDQHLTEGVFRISPMLSNRHFKAEFLPTE